MLSCHSYVGVRRLRAWEAVVFGALHVEMALAGRGVAGYACGFSAGDRGVSGVDISACVWLITPA
jgi:hypothetical protein